MALILDLPQMLSIALMYGHMNQVGRKVYGGNKCIGKQRKWAEFVVDTAQCTMVVQSACRLRFVSTTELIGKHKRTELFGIMPRAESGSLSRSHVKLTQLMT